MSCQPFCPTVRVYDPPVTVVNDVFHPQIVEVVHQINVVNRHHCVPCEKHLYQYCYQDEVASEQNSNNSNRSQRRHRSGKSYISKSKKKKMK
ncbi:hypothetical protein FHS16_003200 [Paenibacillus endophyticus]|uniref:Spore coat protein D n=1 Tax=Paenibacillus endophyticus TaxID=1294268 RepID=A0A7W5C8M1_9BACL|nr:hypothetical protein [Paenibacillus endophyticus]MBB3153141.1 hypothetical protein [Paenibacillus endophyticus]